MYSIPFVKLALKVSVISPETTESAALSTLSALSAFSTEAHFNGRLKERRAGIEVILVVDPLLVTVC